MDWARAHATLLREAQQQLGQGMIVLANNNATVWQDPWGAQKPQHSLDASMDSNVPMIGYGGRQFERWCRDDFDKNSIDEDIRQLQLVSSGRAQSQSTQQQQQQQGAKVDTTSRSGTATHPSTGSLSNTSYTYSVALVHGGEPCDGSAFSLSLRWCFLAA
jgi:hypothetical protein